MTQSFSRRPLIERVKAFFRSPPPPSPPGPAPLIRVAFADLLSLGADAVANAADWTLLGGTGVDGSVHRAAGPELARHLLATRARLETAQVLATPGFAAPASLIVHTCAPPFDPWGNEAELLRVLALAHSRILACAAASGAVVLAVPLLGAGAFGWPAPLAARAAKAGLDAFIPPPGSSLREVVYCARSEPALAALASAFAAKPERLSDGPIPYDPGFCSSELLEPDELKKLL